MITKKETRMAKKIPVAKKNRVLQYGMMGEDVTTLQKLLQKDGSTVKITGLFNIGTVSAVKAFQRRHNLPTTGIVDAKTRAALKKVK